MNEQQKHLEDLLNQRKELTQVMNETGSKLNEIRDNILRVDGVIQYLTEILGVKLPEPQDTERSSDSEESNSTEG